MKLDRDTALFLEFQSVSHYLLGELPESWVQENLGHYRRGLRFHLGSELDVIALESQAWHWSRVDAHVCRIRDPFSQMRLRLLLTHAIWETDPRTAHFYLPKDLGALRLLWVLLISGIRGVWRRLWHFR